MKKLAPFQSDPGEFPSGVIGFSPCVLELQDEIDLYFFLHRHLHGDDGDVPEGVHLKNLFAWRNGLRVWSTYNTTGSPDGRIWIVTEADRSATHILLPSEYGGRDERQKCLGLFDIPGNKDQYSEFPQPSAGNGRKTVPSRTVTWSDPATESSSPVRPETPVSLAPESDRMPAMKCDMCGLRKESVRSRRRITIGLQSGTVRINFCDECAATIETLP